MSDNIFKIFIAYSRRDEEMLGELRVHLNPLERSQKLHVWYDGKIEPGAVWNKTIKSNLHNADLVLLLISASAIASDYFYEQEVKDALERHESGNAKVVPLILKPCAWQITPLGQLQALPKDGKPITKWLDRDDAYNDAAQQLWKIIQEQEIKKVREDKQKEKIEKQELETKRKKEQEELEKQELETIQKIEQEEFERQALEINQKKKHKELEKQAQETMLNKEQEKLKRQALELKRKREQKLINWEYLEVKAIVEFEEKKNFEKAFRILLDIDVDILTEKGILILGYMYQTGIGGVKDTIKSSEYLSRVAEDKVNSFFYSVSRIIHS